MTYANPLLQSPSTHGGPLHIPTSPLRQPPEAGTPAPGVTTFENLGCDLLHLISAQILKDDVAGTSNLATITHANTALNRQTQPLANAAEVLHAIRQASDVASLCRGIDVIGALDKSLQTSCWDAALIVRDGAPWLDEAGRQQITDHMHQALPQEAPGTRWAPADWQAHRNAVQLLLLNPPNGPYRSESVRARHALEMLTRVYRDTSVSPRLLASIIGHLQGGFEARPATLRQQLAHLRAQASPAVAAVLDVLLACTAPAHTLELFNEQMQRARQIENAGLRNALLRAAAHNWSACMRVHNDPLFQQAFETALAAMPAGDQFTLLRRKCVPRMAKDPGVTAALPFIRPHIEAFPAEKILESVAPLCFSEREATLDQSTCELMGALLGSQRLQRGGAGEQARVLTLVLTRLSRIAIPATLLTAIESMKAGLPASLQQGIDVMQRLHAISLRTDAPLHSARRDFLNHARTMLNAIGPHDAQTTSARHTDFLHVLAFQFDRWMQPLLPLLMARLECAEPTARAAMVEALAGKMSLMTNPERQQASAQMIDACSRLPVTLASRTLRAIALNLARHGNDSSRKALRHACSMLPVHMRPPIPPLRAAAPQA